jgi:hypothetical protein
MKPLGQIESRGYLGTHHGPFLAMCQLTKQVASDLDAGFLE